MVDMWCVVCECWVVFVWLRVCVVVLLWLVYVVYCVCGAFVSVGSLVLDGCGWWGFVCGVMW